MTTGNAQARCPLCRTALRMSIATSKRNKVSIALICPVDGRHFRGFIADQDYVRRVLDLLGEQQIGDEPA